MSRKPFRGPLSGRLVAPGFAAGICLALLLGPAWVSAGQPAFTPHTGQVVEIPGRPDRSGPPGPGDPPQPAPSPPPAPAPNPQPGPPGPGNPQPAPTPGGGAYVPPAVPQVCADGPALTAAEARSLAEAAAAAVDDRRMTIAVVDRAGNPLAVFRKADAVPGDEEEALGLARTGAFFSNNTAPLSSRTVRFVSGIHFPPGIDNTPNAALYGIENTNRGCDLNVPFLPGKAIRPAGNLSGLACNALTTLGCGSGPVTGKSVLAEGPVRQRDVNPGGVPIFRGATGALVGGLGVAGIGPDEAEYAAFRGAFQGAFGVPFSALGKPGVVFIDGIRLPFVENLDAPPGTAPGNAAGLTAVVAPAHGSCAPEGFLMNPRPGSRLTEPEVRQILQQALDAARRTRAVIRLPSGSRARMVIAVGDLDGRILGLYRMIDAPVFSIDVAVAKARNVVYFSGGDPNVRGDLPGVPAGTAVTNRTIGFGAQPLYPAGISAPEGPFFDLFRRDTANPCSQGFQAPSADQNGVVFFAGSIPLYRGDQLVGGLGVSGDGVEQDDYVSFQGAAGFRPPERLWADQVVVRGVRLPFLKFPRNPEG